MEKKYLWRLPLLLVFAVCLLVTPRFCGGSKITGGIKAHPFAQLNIFNEDFSGLKEHNGMLCPCSMSRTQKEDIDADGTHSLIKTIVTPTSASITRLKNIITGEPSKVVLVCVHGTWSSHHSYVGNPERQLSQEIVSFASLLATMYKTPVEIISYQWSGSPHRDNRKMAGILLSNVLINEYPDALIWTLAHSHGCSVVHHAASMLKKKNRSIDTAIHLCAPDLDISADDVPIKKVYNFYGTRDMVQIAGSAMNKMSLCRTIEHDYSQPNSVYNLRVQNNGVNVDHFNIKLPVVKNLPWILAIVDTFYPTYGYFDANLYEDTQTPLIAIRDTAHRNRTDAFIQDSVDYSRKQEFTYLKHYKCSIHNEYGNSFTDAAYEWGAKMASDVTHKVAGYIQKFRSKKKEPPAQV